MLKKVKYLIKFCGWFLVYPSVMMGSLRSTEVTSIKAWNKLMKEYTNQQAEMINSTKWSDVIIIG